MQGGGNKFARLKQEVRKIYILRPNWDQLQKMQFQGLGLESLVANALSTVHTGGINACEV